MRKVLPTRCLDSFRKVVSLFAPWLTRTYYICNVIDTYSDSLLDVGCGAGVESMLLAEKCSFRYVGLDIFRPYLVQAKKRLPKARANFILCDIRYLPIRDKTFDIALCMNVLEHLQREEGFKLIADLELVTRRQIIVWVPIGLFEPGALDNNPWQAHRSAWSEDDLTRLGFTVKARLSFHIYRRSRIYRSRFQSVMVNFFYPLLKFIPHLPDDMLCVKSKRSTDYNLFQPPMMTYCI